MHQFGRAYKPSDAIGIPPGMPPTDYKIWMQWKDALPRSAYLYFNIRIGRGSLPGRVPANEEEMMLFQQTAKRVDVVVWGPNAVTIVELHERAGPTAVGRLLCYQSCWLREPQLPQNIKLLLITDREDGDMRDLCADHGIDYLVLAGLPNSEINKLLAEENMNGGS